MSQPERHHRNWTQEEKDFLSEKWGRISDQKIGNALGRTTYSIRKMAYKMGLGSFIMNGDYVTVNQLIKALGYAGTNHNFNAAWIEKRNFPCRYASIGAKKYRVVRLDDFWKWAGENRSFLNLSRMEPLSLGKEPDWVPEKRANDVRNADAARRRPWTAEDDSRLRCMLSQYRYTCSEIAQVLCRTSSAVKSRCWRLDIKDRPLEDDPDWVHAVWTDADYDILTTGIRSSKTIRDISQKVGKSEDAVRQKIFSTYMTEDRDKVRALLGDGPWGSNAPSPTIQKAKDMSGRKSEVKRLIASLAGILNVRAELLEQEVNPDESCAA